MDQKTGFGKRLKEERERLGFAQPAFAALAEASKSSAASWERETAYPNAKALQTWAKVGVDVAYLLTGEKSGSSNVLTADEAELLDLFREAPLAVKAAAIGALKGGTTAPKKEPRYTVDFGSATIAQAAGGNIVNKGRRK
ncbi:XRE family transcriptional regulator [Comamonas resistens]|uniref:XRE family transcriptional regulator n=1 Tax=Comamonas resistens TaxID=3046670 RepID=UPI0039BD4E84